MKKLYVVINGYEPGVYSTWEECKKNVNGFSSPLYKSFKESDLKSENIDEKDIEFLNFYNKCNKKDQSIKTPVKKIVDLQIIEDSICVDGACSGNPGLGEFRCVDVKSGEVIFSSSEYENTTNNLMEFFALCEAVKYTLSLAPDKRRPIYSDSITAMAWVRDRVCKTSLRPMKGNYDSYSSIKFWDKWLKENDLKIKDCNILKWDTKKWGEIPADFNRK